MEIGYILNELWSRRRWVVLGLVLSVLVAATTVYSIPSFQKKTLELGAASTEVLVDAPQSPLGALDADIGTLVTRAQVYAILMQSQPVKERIARELGVAPGRIATIGPQPGASTPGQRTSAEERGAELLMESNQLRLFASSAAEIPIVSLFAQATDAQTATALANAGAHALATYVREIQDRQHISPAQRIEIRQLGQASGGLVNKGVDVAAAFLAFLGAFVFWCLLVLFAARTARSWRAAHSATARDRDAGTAADSHVGDLTDASETPPARKDFAA